MTAALKQTAKARLLTIDELAERLRISKRSAYRVARIIGRQAGGFAEDDVDRFIASRMRGPRQSSERHVLSQHIADRAAQLRADLGTCCSGPVLVYFVRGANLIKIGRSRAHLLSSRMAHLQAQSPIALRLLRVSRGADMEATMHTLFRCARAHGEWFRSDIVEAFLGEIDGCIRCALESKSCP